MVEKVMKKIKYYVRGAWVDEHLVQWLTTIFAMMNFGLGIAVFVGGVSRFQVPTYQPLLDMHDAVASDLGLQQGQVWMWGAWIILSATLMITPFKWINSLGIFLGMAWMCQWAALFVVSVMTYKESAATPCVVYGGLAMVHFALLVARILEHDEE